MDGLRIDRLSLRLLEPRRQTRLAAAARGGGAVSGGTALLVALLLLLGNAFFVGAEFALVSARRTQIEPRAEAGSRMARTTLRAMENMSLVIGVNQLGITVCSLVLGAVGEPAVAHLLEPAFEAAHVPESLLHPISFVVAPRDRGLPARRARRDDPQEPRAGRPRPGRAGARARRSGASSPCCGRSSW